MRGRSWPGLVCEVYATLPPVTNSAIFANGCNRGRAPIAAPGQERTVMATFGFVMPWRPRGGRGCHSTCVVAGCGYDERFTATLLALEPSNCLW